MQASSAAAACSAIKPAAHQHTVQVQEDKRGLEFRARFGTRKLSWGGKLSVENSSLHQCQRQALS
uniref:Uncharacterized protein n=1 Tax=Oryza barthii TaxID=65489 RepID=A0A0D3GJ97_9ORYZ